MLGSEPVTRSSPPFATNDALFPVVLDGDIEGKKAILSWDGSLGYVDGGSAATSDCSQWTVAGVAKPQNYSFEVDTANKCIWLKNNKPGLILIVR